MQKKLFRLSVPIFVEAIMNTIIGSVDTIMLSSYSDDAVAAVSIANQILFLIQVLACIVTTGTSILCAQYIGAQKTEEEQNDLILYDRKGEEMQSVTVDSALSHGQVKGDEVIINSATRCAVYRMNGVKKYEGALKSAISYIFPGKGMNRFILIQDSKIKFIKLK